MKLLQLDPVHRFTWNPSSLEALSSQVRSISVVLTAVAFNPEGAAGAPAGGVGVAVGVAVAVGVGVGVATAAVEAVAVLDHAEVRPNLYAATRYEYEVLGIPVVSDHASCAGVRSCTVEKSEHEAPWHR